MSLPTPRTLLRIPPGKRQPACTMTPGIPVRPGDPSGAGETGKACSSSRVPWLRAGVSGSSKVPFGSSLSHPWRQVVSMMMMPHTPSVTCPGEGPVPKWWPSRGHGKTHSALPEEPGDTQGLTVGIRGDDLSVTRVGLSCCAHGAHAVVPAGCSRLQRRVFSQLVQL